jgi:hypothetical protein
MRIIKKVLIFFNVMKKFPWIRMDYDFTYSYLFIKKKFFLHSLSASCESTYINMNQSEKSNKKKLEYF